MTKIEVGYGDDHSEVEVVVIVEMESRNDGKEKKWKGFQCFRSDLPKQQWVSLYRKQNYLFEMNRFQDTMKITSIVQLGNKNVTIVIATFLRESRHLI